MFYFFSFLMSLLHSITVSHLIRATNVGLCEFYLEKLDVNKYFWIPRSSRKGDIKRHFNADLVRMREWVQVS